MLSLGIHGRNILEIMLAKITDLQVPKKEHARQASRCGDSSGREFRLLR